MQLRLSTVFCLCAVFGLGLGWYVDRSSLAQRCAEHDENCERRIHEQGIGTTHYVRARRTFLIAHDLRDSPTPLAIDQTLEFELVWSVFMLHFYKTSIDEALTDPDEVLELASAILRELDCESSDEFFSLAVSSKQNVRDGRSASFLEGKGDQRRFREFIDSALATNGYAWIAN